MVRNDKHNDSDCVEILPSYYLLPRTIQIHWVVIVYIKRIRAMCTLHQTNALLVLRSAKCIKNLSELELSNLAKTINSSIAMLCLFWEGHIALTASRPCQQPHSLSVC